MRAYYWTHHLQLHDSWTISTLIRNGQSSGLQVSRVVFVELRDQDGCWGLGEASPAPRYRQSIETVHAFLDKVDPGELSFRDLERSLARLRAIEPYDPSAFGAVETALHDGAARLAGQSLGAFLGLPAISPGTTTSFSIGIDDPANIERKLQAAAAFPVLKIKLGSEHDDATLRAVREHASDKTVRVDANEAWPNARAALARIAKLAEHPNIEFVEQPLPAGAPAEEMRLLKKESPLPVMADESYHTADDAAFCAEAFHAVNVKLVKTGGVAAAKAALEAARAVGLKTMLGCMIESSALISAAAHLAPLTDYQDLDGNLLVSNDPYRGVVADGGALSFGEAPLATGLQVLPR